jgi:hypothetical protein
MKLARNTTPGGKCKYALISLEKVARTEDPSGRIAQALQDLEQAGILDYGLPGTEREFFAMLLRDRNTPSGLLGYAQSVEERDPEFASEVRDLAGRAGLNSPFCKDPD